MADGEGDSCPGDGHREDSSDEEHTMEKRSSARVGMIAGEKKRRRCAGGPYEAIARDEVLGGIPPTAIAGIFPISLSGVEVMTPTWASSVQNRTQAKEMA